MHEGALLEVKRSSGVPLPGVLAAVLVASADHIPSDIHDPSVWCYDRQLHLLELVKLRPPDCRFQHLKKRLGAPGHVTEVT